MVRDLPPLQRRAFVQAVGLGLVGGGLVGCRSMGLTPWKVTTESTDESGKRIKKTYEVDDWDDFTSTLSAVGDDFSDHASRVKTAMVRIASELTDLPPPGRITLRDVHADLADAEGQEQLDFIAGGAKRGGDAYDFKYVRLGIPAFDDFFHGAARTYAVAYQRRECDTRRRALSEKLLGRKLEGKLEDEARTAVSRGGGQGAEYLARLQGMSGPLGTSAAETGSAAAGLATAGLKLAKDAPRAIRSPKVLLHVDQVVLGVSESVGLIRDSAGLLAASA
jgi:hypothetical protein